MGSHRSALSLPIKTERLVLRALLESDLQHHQALYSHRDVLRYLCDEALSGDAFDAHFTRRLNPLLPDEGEWLNLAVLHQDEFIGEVGLTLASRSHRQCEIGYVFDPAFSGQGFATEAARAMVDLAFTLLHAHRISARMDARNHASAAVAGRLGMSQEAHLIDNEFVKGEWTDETIWALRREQWLMPDETQHPKR